MPSARKIAQVISSECLVLRSRQAARALTRKYDEAIRPLGIHASQLSLLVAAATAGEQGAPLGRIAQALSMDQTTLSRNVAPLVKSGLLVLTQSPDDARSRLLRLSASGERLLQAAYPRWKAVQRSLTRALEEQGIADLHGQLGRLVTLGDEP